MAVVWFWTVAAMLTVYAVLDGFDIGAGIVHLLVARTEAERRTILTSIGPVWNGNEVWLIAAGGSLFLAFPTLYASSFSGFYLPLMIVLWFLILRGISVEFRSQITSPAWSPLWDVIFSAASAGLAGFYGAAIGNIVRGVPLDASGYFFLPLWTDFLTTGPVGILDWFTIIVGLATFLAMGEHGALWIAMKTEGDLAVRARRLAARGWWAVLLITVLVAALSPIVQSHLLDRISHHPWGYVFPAGAILGLTGMKYYNYRDSDSRAFVSSCLYIIGIVSSTAFGLFPFLLPSNIEPTFGLSIYNAAAPIGSLRLGFAWFVPGVILAAIYLVFAYRGFAGKASVDEEVY
ncbi:MAG TPA: cytochrome d ubiquinol oxidase subunit II [Candidatus Binataceae bacterium]|nr:cytochrome d ubiquinol oxidase subunit II [Candidatus Binataceae bacterium]